MGGSGQGEDDSIAKLRKRLEECNLPEEARTIVEKELNRMKRSQHEYANIETYLETMADLPWGIYDDENNDIANAKTILDEDHYGLEQVKKRIIEFLAVNSLSDQKKGTILCFVGPPGVGKTSLGKSIARSMNRKFYRIAFGGIRDEALIRGFKRTYVGSQPGVIIQSLKKVKSANPLFLLDEIDKIGRDWKGDPSSAMLEVLDPE